jgi:DNA (cytosine-5)-methyltransferase 1
VKHLGDITKINGALIELVDVIVGGSPCQDLSVAGKRAGLDGGRSGLFMEQIRIVREQRNACIRNIGMSDTENRNRSDLYVKSGTSGICSDSEGGQTNAASTEETVPSIARSDNPIRPRFMVWENVPGAFSSNKAEDFRIVLEETARIADSNAVIPRPPKNKWATAGCIMGDGWSIAWRVQDAQFWGVPQRRRRIALVADFGGFTAPEILFERKGVSGDIAESGTEREGAAGDVESRTCESITNRGYAAGGVAETLRAGCHGALPMVAHKIAGDAAGSVGAAGCYPINTQIITRHQALGRGTGFGMGEDGDPAYTLQAGHEHGIIAYGICSYASNSMKSANPHSGIYEADTSRTLDLSGGNPACNQGGIAVVESAGFCPEESAKTRGIGYAEEQSPSLRAGVTPAIVMAHGQANAEILHDQSPTLNCNHEQPIACYQNGQGDLFMHYITCSLATNSNPSGRNVPLMLRHYAVRRLTPLECERLQGYPDGWTDIPNTTIGGKLIKTSDSARYKALGNSIALPPWRFVLGRIRAQGAVTMGSLFDGIGGFPLIWNESGGQTLWASEIEPFCIAVTKHHFTATR